MADRRRVAVMIDLDWPLKYHVEVFAGCQQYATRAGWDCTINPFAGRTLTSRRGGGPYDGVLARATRKLAETARQARVPVVNVWMNSPARSLASVFPDVEAAGRMAAEHLLGRGFRQLGYLGFARDVCSQLQLTGFRSVARREGSPCLVHRFGRASVTRSAAHWEGFIAGLRAWVDTWTTPIGIYVTHDLQCRYLIDVCRHQGLQVPRDFAVIGTFNESVICASPAPTLTSIDLGYTQVGYRAAELLDRLMDGEPPPEGPEWIAPAELFPRQSTDAYAVDDPLVGRALRFIAEHGHERINVGTVARTIPTNRRTLERRFRESLGRTVAEEITRLRVERVKRRLVETDEPLKAVASGAGFTSAQQLYKVFLRTEGLSPGQFRRQRQNARLV